MRAAVLAGAVIMTVATPVFSQEVLRRLYVCERDVEIPVLYLNGGEPLAVLFVEGKLEALKRGLSGTGARYTAPDGLSGYTWWTEEDRARLGWRDGRHGDENTIFEDCRPTAEQGG